MDIYKINKIDELIKGNPYVGRGIVLGRSADGEKAVSAYFIMGRSANSRNRVFTLRGGELFTEPFDASRRTPASSSMPPSAVLTISSSSQMVTRLTPSLTGSRPG